MLISQEVSGVSPLFTLERSGNQVTATLSYGLTGYYDEELGYYLWDGEISAAIGGDGAYFDQEFDRPMDITFVATLADGVAEAGSYSVYDYIGGAGIEHIFNVAVYSTAAVHAGSADADYVFGSDFDDRIAGAAGDDNVEGGNGDDVLRGDDGTDTLKGGDGIDRLAGGANDDYLWGGFDADVAGGGSGDDIVAGGSGKDVLAGGAGVDSISGGAGADTIDGGRGGDWLIGAAGGDRFYYDSTVDSRNTAIEHDLIADFTLTQDVIDLHDIDAKASEADNQDFTFIGTGAFTAEGQVRFQTAGSDGFILVNTQGTTGAEMAIRLFGVLTISDINFIL